jgi:NADH dehydrogenase FAD-containing subunit
VVILGSGYAGLRVAQQLERSAGESGAPEVLLVDRHPYHQIITNLPQAAGGRATSLTGRKASILKAVILEAYRLSASGHIGSEHARWARA